MTIPAPTILSDDPWFGPAVISEKNRKDIIKKMITPTPAPTPTLHEVMYDMATKVQLSCVRDQPWVSGAGR